MVIVACVADTLRLWALAAHLRGDAGHAERQWYLGNIE